VLRAFTGAFAAMFSSLAIGLVTLLIIGALGFGLFTFLGIGFARRGNKE